MVNIKDLAESHYLKMKVRDVNMLIKFAQTLRKYREGILNYYEHRITTGALEGTNAKIRVMQRKAYSYRDEEYLKLKIYALHETKVQNIA